MFGTAASTRSATSPASTIASGSDNSSAASGGPIAAHIWANACSMPATPGPRTSMPVSRHGAMPFAGSPSHLRLTHSPVTKPMRPSTASILR